MTSPVQKVYLPGGGDGALPNNDDHVALEILHEPIAPVSEAVAPFTDLDDGTVPNRLEMEHEQYDDRIVALTLVHNGPSYAGIMQHNMGEDTAAFSIADAQQPPWAVDETVGLPYNEPLET